LAKAIPIYRDGGVEGLTKYMEIELINYIKQAKDFGLSEFEIKKNLLEAGWEAAAVEESFEHQKAEANKLAESNFPGPNYSQTPSVVKSAQITSMMFKSEKNSESAPAESLTQKPPALETATIQSGFNIPALENPKTRNAILAALAVVILAVGGYFFYVYAYNSPQKVWEKFTKLTGAQIYKSAFTIGYEDKGELAGDAMFLPFKVKDVKLSFSGNTYGDISDPKNPQSSSEIQYSFGSGNTNFNTGFKFLVINKVLYLNISENPFLNSMFQSMGQGQKIDWIKVDLNTLQEKMASENIGSNSALLGVFNENFSRELGKIWQDATLVKIDKYLGKEKVDNTNTFHFKNTLDQKALTDAFNASIDKIAKAVNDQAKNDSEKIKDTDLSTIKTVIAKLIEKVKVEQFETWIGTTDFKLYKIALKTNAPSVVSLIKNATDFTQPLAKARDAKRLGDVRQIASALELYFNDYNGYPEGSNGLPQGGITPTYIGLMPTSPTPPGGSCTDYYNSYWYQPMGTKSTTNGKEIYSSYQLTFCLGNGTGGYNPGIAKLSPSGIESGIPCPTPEKPEQCKNPQPVVEDVNNTIQKKVTDFVSKLDFSAEFNFNATYSDYGKKQTLEAPGNAFDIVSMLDAAKGKSRDAKRLADVRQLASAFELYFNDFNQYPKSLNELAPKYMGVLPTAPVPVDGTCTEADNNYSYQLINKNTYQLNFCLGQDTSGYNAGKRTLTQAGIN